MTYPLEIYFTRDRMPEINVLVYVAGGLAKWTGHVWLSMTAQSAYCDITWPVKWWAYVLQGAEEPQR